MTATPNGTKTDERNLALVAINESLLLQSLLYDLNLLPEQLEEGSKHWGYMLSVVGHFQRAALSTPAAEVVAEPVAWMCSERKNAILSAAQFNSCLPKNRTTYTIPLYTHPQGAQK